MSKTKLNGRDEYIRIGSDYYKRIINQDAGGWPFEEIRGWTRQAILDDFGKDYLKSVKRYDAFTNIPDNGVDDVEVMPNLYNLYKPVKHSPQPGQWPWTEILLRHVFDDQYEQGLDYVKLLIERPLQILPVLCLVSRENTTGKTTFLNWLRMIFDANMIIVGNQDIHSRFNSHYAHKLIIAVDESKIDKETALEKLKALATQKTINYEGKFQNAQTIPFFGKFILCSNYEDNFLNVKDEDIRYWVRKLPKPTNNNINIEDDMQGELNAFMYDILRRPYSTKKVSRMWFDPDKIMTDALRAIKFQSKTWLYRDLQELIEAYFLKNESMKEFNADAIDIKQKWFAANSRVDISFITKVLKQEFKLDRKLCRYIPFEDPSCEQKVSRIFNFSRLQFVENEYNKKSENSENEVIFTPKSDEIVTDLPENMPKMLPF